MIQRDKRKMCIRDSYDTDGMEGLYVPNSQFRETSKDVASGAMSGNMNMSMGSTGNSLAQWLSLIHI